MSQIPQNTSGSRKGAKRASDTEQPSVIPLRASDTLESTMPPTPLRELLAAEGASVYVLTGDTALLETVHQGGGDQYPVFLAESWPALREAITEGRCGIALLDLEAVSGTLVDRLKELARLSPALVTLIASTRDRADGLLDLLSQRKIHRLLIKPPTVGITRLLLESSVNRHMELKRRPDLQARPSASGGAMAGGRSWLLAGGLVLALLAAAGVTTYLGRSGSESPAAAATVSAPNAPALPPGALEPVYVPAGISGLPNQGATDAAIDPGVGPQGTGVPVAIAGPFPVEGFEPAPPGPTPEALEARYAEVEAALVADDLDAAAGLLADLETLDPASTRLTFLSAQLERARLAVELAAAAEAAALAAEAAANPSELTSLVALTRARLAQGQIDAPAGDSALTYLTRARGLDVTAPEVVALSGEVGAGLLDRAEAQIAAGRLEAAEALLARAQGLGVAGANVAALELSLNVAREARASADQDALLAVAADRRAQGLLFEPAGESAVDAVLEVRGLDPDHPGLVEAVSALETALTAAAQVAIAGGDWGRAEGTIEALLRLGVAAPVIDPLRGELAYGRTQAAYLAEASPATGFEVLEFAPPVYPPRAVARDTEGWVDLEFVIDREGRPRELRVTAAEPPGEFDAAALEAVGNYVFVPFEQDGRVYERRISLRLRFALE